ncbi:hypothetical protein AVEN_126417-1 [Araneus ventricosus]|uniref:Uncharacterized protein n=1 Tax=Araneus ventricosus TaxID=182803 RepID=A0A4Y2LIY8_ARAVE|nr:hypothetical protein AVEN_126417-1 [Araneus ventricosus]
MARFLDRWLKLQIEKDKIGSFATGRDVRKHGSGRRNAEKDVAVQSSLIKFIVNTFMNNSYSSGINSSSSSIASGLFRKAESINVHHKKNSHF